MKKINAKKICLILVMFAASIVIISNSFSRNVKLEEVKLKSDINKISKNSFAIMIEKEDGSGYEETESFPTRMIFNSEMSGCIDGEGNTIDGSIEYISSTNSVKLKTKNQTYCYLYFDFYNDIRVSLAVNGEKSDTPVVGKYEKTVECTGDSNLTYSERYQRLELTNLTSPEVCSLNYVTDTTEYTNLNNMIKDTNNHVLKGNEGIVSESARYAEDEYVILSNSEYLNVSMYTGAAANESGTSASDAFTFENDRWSSNLDVMATGKFYHLKFNLPEDALYRLCYTMPSSTDGYSTGNRMYIYSTGQKNILSTFYSVSDTAKESCMDIGYLTSDDYVNITQRAYTTIAPMSIYIKKAVEVKSIDAGYRYEGIDPDNYIWFNNELWRIIGSVPTCTSENCETVENLVKIIRNKPIGAISYDATVSDNAYTWGTNTLYTLLNEYYYGKKDATEENVCNGYQTSAKVKCDYTKIGISDNTNDHYSRMIENIFWNTGPTQNGALSETAYIEETKKQTVQNKIGLMSASDYGYASANSKGINMNVYSVGGNNWLYQGYDYTLTYHKSALEILRVHPSGIISNNVAYQGRPVRPVVYLNPDVYIISGDGTIINPYIIGM